MYIKLIRPILDRLDSETCHLATRECLHLLEKNPNLLNLLEKFNYKKERFYSKKLEVKIGEIIFDNPLIVGAGWDKEARAVKGLFTLGFAGVEVGSVLAYPQKGNPKPRQFMLSSGVCLNRMGFNSSGVDLIYKNLQSYKNSHIPIGISIGKNKKVTDDKAAYVHGLVADKLYEFASYFVINVSSPNTPGLRKLQDKKPLTEIVRVVNAVMDKKGKRKPLFVKIAPELSERAIEDVIEVAYLNKLTGIIATNTTIDSGIKAKYGQKWQDQPGGLSGDDGDFRRMATQKISYIYRRVGKKLKIIGVGGVNSTDTALEKIMAGASLVEIVTGLRQVGPQIAGRINHGLVDFMKKQNIKNITELVGIKAKKII